GICMPTLFASKRECGVAITTLIRYRLQVVQQLTLFLLDFVVQALPFLYVAHLHHSHYLPGLPTAALTRDLLNRILLSLLCGLVPFLPTQFIPADNNELI